MKPKVFISHSSVDTWVAIQIASHVKAIGADTFLDEADIEHGDDFDDRIVEASKHCSELLLLLTPWSVERPYIWLEIGFFRHDDKRIVGVLHGLKADDISSDPRVPVLLKKIDLVDINNIQSYLSQLDRRVRASGEAGSNPYFFHTLGPIRPMRLPLPKHLRRLERASSSTTKSRLATIGITRFRQRSIEPV